MKIKQNITKQEMFLSLQTWDSYVRNDTASQYTVITHDTIYKVYEQDGNKYLGRFEESELSQKLLNNPAKYKYEKCELSDIDYTMVENKTNMHVDLVKELLTYLSNNGGLNANIEINDFLKSTNLAEDVIRNRLVAMISQKLIYCPAGKNLGNSEVGRGKKILENTNISAALLVGGLELYTRNYKSLDSSNDLVKEKFEDEKGMISTKPTNTMKKIFISHSFLDRDKVEELIDLIESIGIKPSQIFCSSFPGYGVELGEDFLERLKKELNEDVLVFFILTQNFYNSPICLCEMGATWIKTNKSIPILIPPFSFKDVKGVFPVKHGMEINDKYNLNLLKDNLENYFSLTPLNATNWERKRDKFLSDINIHIDKHIKSSNTERIEKEIMAKIISSSDQRISRIDLRHLLNEEPENSLQIGNIKLKTVSFNSAFYLIA